MTRSNKQKLLSTIFVVHQKLSADFALTISGDIPVNTDDFALTISSDIPVNTDDFALTARADIAVST